VPLKKFIRWFYCVEITRLKSKNLKNIFKINSLRRHFFKSGGFFWKMTAAATAQKRKKNG